MENQLHPVFDEICNYLSISWIQLWFSQTPAEVMVWIINYIPLFCIDVIIHPSLRIFLPHIGRTQLYRHVLPLFTHYNKSNGSHILRWHRMGHHFADNICKSVCFKESDILNEVLRKSVPHRPMDNKSTDISSNYLASVSFFLNNLSRFAVAKVLLIHFSLRNVSDFTHRYVPSIESL